MVDFNIWRRRWDKMGSLTAQAEYPFVFVLGFAPREQCFLHIGSDVLLPSYHEGD